VFGPAFVKVCACFSFPIKIWRGGHEYAKRAATAAGIGFTELDNGLAATDDPAGLQRICDTLGHGHHPGVLRALVGAVHWPSSRVTLIAPRCPSVSGGRAIGHPSRNEFPSSFRQR